MLKYRHPTGLEINILVSIYGSVYRFWSRRLSFGLETKSLDRSWFRFRFQEFGAGLGRGLRLEDTVSFHITAGNCREFVWYRRVLRRLL